MMVPAAIRRLLPAQGQLVNPSASSGTYWLYTPQMSGPAQFYCDQETDGGGWAMIGRGRESWTENYHGRGKAEQLYQNPTGFDAVQLPADKVDALLNGTRPQDLADGVRLHRALDVDGTKWQDLTAKRVASPRWSWSLRARMYWSDITIKNPYPYTRYNYSSREPQMGRVFSHDSYDFRGLYFVEQASQGYKQGFSYGVHAQITSWLTADKMNNQSSYIHRPADDSNPLWCSLRCSCVRR